MKTVLFALAVLSVVARPATAQAHRIRVWYDTAGEPVPFNRTALVTEIQEAMREWEHHGAGKIVLEWRGVTRGRAGGGVDDLIFGWDPGLMGTSTCAETWVYTGFRLPPMGRVNLNPSFWNGSMLFTTVPVTGRNCRVIRSNLVHETTHWFRFDWTHPPESALASTCAAPGVCSDHIAMHVWNSDMMGINQNPYVPLFAPTFPPQPTLLLTDAYDPWSGAVTSTGGDDIGPQNFVASLGVGGPAEAYARAFTTVVSGRGPTVVVEQGSGGLPWGRRRAMNEMTFRQTCVTGVPGTSDMYAAWPAPLQRTLASSPPGSASFANAGERTIRFSESHDGGETWTSPADVPGAFTRTGVSCGFDATRNRVVLVFAESVGFTVQYTERVPGAAGAAAWRTPRAVGSGILPFVMTYETPLVAFDPFTAGSGLLTWTGSTHRAPLVARLVHDGAAYAVRGVTVTATTLAEQNALRTSVVPNPFFTDIHLAFGMNTPVPAQVRVRKHDFLTVSSDTDPSSSAGYDRYVGAGSNRFFYETAYIRQSIPVP
jgi:hypothetical protein